ncbi:hypothetical protein C8R45DRAFT_1206765 [Mycena sanguinolenta]|nr:hypothetical protein C8R45DRAFT_1206765 [Mycena sanguinolenta]
MGQARVPIMGVEEKPHVPGVPPANASRRRRTCMAPSARDRALAVLETPSRTASAHIRASPHWRARRTATRDTDARSPAMPLMIAHSMSQRLHAPRSARRWAHTAHLHELRSDGGAFRPASAQRLGVATTTTRESIAVVPRSAPSPAVGLSPPDLGLGSDVMGLGEWWRCAAFRDPSASPALDLVQGVSDGDADAWVDTDGAADTDVGMECLDRLAVGA